MSGFQEPQVDTFSSLRRTPRRRKPVNYADVVTSGTESESEYALDDLWQSDSDQSYESGSESDDEDDEEESTEKKRAEGGDVGFVSRSHHRHRSESPHQSGGRAGGSSEGRIGTGTYGLPSFKKRTRPARDNHQPGHSSTIRGFGSGSGVGRRRKRHRPMTRYVPRTPTTQVKNRFDRCHEINIDSLMKRGVSSNPHLVLPDAARESYVQLSSGIVLYKARFEDSKLVYDAVYVPSQVVLGEFLHRSEFELFKIVDGGSTFSIPHSVSAQPVDVFHVSTTSLTTEENGDSMTPRTFYCRFSLCPQTKTFTKIVPWPANPPIGRLPRVLDLFCGAGGFSSSAVGQGFDIVAGVDIDEHACSAFQLNHSAARVFHQSVQSFLDDRVDLGSIDLLLAGPPCPGFSKANAAAARQDEERSLTLHLSRAIRIYQPSAVVVENVTGILSDRGKSYFNALQTGLLEFGYDVSWNVLPATSFGSSQKRSRVFIVGTRGVRLPSRPRHLASPPPPVSTVLSRVKDSLPDHVPHRLVEWRRLRKAILDVDGLCDTVRAAPSDRWSCLVKHPETQGFRTLSPREVIYIQGFTGAFKLCGDRTAKFRQAGNAVPFELGSAVCDEIANCFEGYEREQAKPFGQPIPRRALHQTILRLDEEAESDPDADDVEGTISQQTPAEIEVNSMEEEWARVVDSPIRSRPLARVPSEDEDEAAVDTLLLPEESSEGKPVPKMSKEEYHAAQKRLIDPTYKTTTPKDQRRLLCSCCHEEKMATTAQFARAPYAMRYPVCLACKQRYFDVERAEDIPDQWVHGDAGNASDGGDSDDSDDW